MKSGQVTGSIQSRWVQAILGGCVLVLLLGLLLPRVSDRPASKLEEATQRASSAGQKPPGDSRSTRRFALPPGATAEEVVADKLSQFVTKRRELLERLARHHNVMVPEEVARFFDAVSAGPWEESQAAFQSLMTLRTNQATRTAYGLDVLWGPIQETYGVAAEAHNWPAQQLLDYGNAILGSLKPGMVYVGGTDPGRFIPTLMNETSGGEQHVILTQNALADNTYVDYIRFLYQDRMQALSTEDSQKAFEQYLKEAQKRLQHDLDSPNEPKQLLPGEDVRIVGNSVHVSGQVAVMSINEKLLQMLMDKNPDATFALEQSFPLASTYDGATSLGPIMQLRVRDEQDALTRERAGQAINYWEDTLQQLFAQSDSSGSSSQQKTYSKMAAEQGSLFLHHKYPEEAERAFQIATEIYPANPEAVLRYTAFLVDQQRIDDALRAVGNGARAAPENKEFQQLLQNLKQMKKK